jgi:hypothetical protein
VRNNEIEERPVCTWIKPSVLVADVLMPGMPQVCSVWMDLLLIQSKSKTSGGQACRLINGHVISGANDRRSGASKG